MCFIISFIILKYIMLIFVDIFCDERRHAFMKLSELFSMQDSFNKNVLKIVANHEHEIKYEKILALQVKIAEMANETNCFKYCNLQKSYDKNVLIKKYVDCLHFIISLGLDNEFTPDEIGVKTSTLNLTSQFENLYIDINDFVVSSSYDNYITLIEDFLSLGSTFGFSEDEILHECMA